MESNLKIHKEAVHEGIRYPCDQCEYSATQKQNLKKHKEIKHEGVLYPCDQCDYIASLEINLKQHKASVHEGIRYPCDMCNFTFTQTQSLHKHKRTKHSYGKVKDTFIKVEDPHSEPPVEDIGSLMQIEMIEEEPIVKEEIIDDFTE